MNKITIGLLALGIGINGSVNAQLKVKLENNTNATNFTYNSSNGDVNLATGNLSIGATSSFYDLSLTSAGNQRLAFRNSNHLSTEAIVEYHVSKQLRFQHWNNSSYNSTLFTLDFNTKKVGVNTTNPAALLHVNGSLGVGMSGNNAGLSITNSSGSTWGVTKFKDDKDHASTSFVRNSSGGEKKLISFGGSDQDGHYFELFNGYNLANIHLHATGTSFFDGEKVIFGGKTSLVSAYKFEIQDHALIKGDKYLAFGDETPNDGKLRIFNSPQYKLSAIDYSKNFYIRKMNSTGGNLGAVMGFQENGVITMGMWERYDGTSNPDYSTADYRLLVNGGILCEKLKVIGNVPNSDHVFEENYELKSIEAVKKFVETNKHLPEVPSAKEFEENGYNVGDMDDLLLRKVEELTLYIIQLKEEISAIKCAK